MFFFGVGLFGVLEGGTLILIKIIDRISNGGLFVEGVLFDNFFIFGCVGYVEILGILMFFLGYGVLHLLLFYNKI